jgi:hypothetical protein
MAPLKSNHGFTVEIPNVTGDNVIGNMDTAGGSPLALAFIASGHLNGAAGRQGRVAADRYIGMGFPRVVAARKIKIAIGIVALRFK